MTRRYGVPLAVMALSLAMAACSSTKESSFYTLQTEASAQAPLASGSPLWVEVVPVQVPQQVQRPQLVLDEGDGKVKIDEFHRWAGSLDDEVGAALSSALSRDLGAVDVYRTPVPAGRPVYRISVKVQRFDSAPGRRTALDAVWSVRRLPDSVTMTCRTALQQPVAAGFPALVAGHRAQIEQLAAQIGSAVQSLRAVPPSTAEAAAAASGTPGVPAPAIPPCPVAGAA